MLLMDPTMTDEARENADERPWEQPGATRRDCAPHRARLVRGMAGLSAVITPVAAVVAIDVQNTRGFSRESEIFWLCGVVAFPIGVALAVTTWVMARKDLMQVQAGLMDRAGERDLADAHNAALGGMIVYTGVLLVLIVQCCHKWGFVPWA